MYSIKGSVEFINLLLSVSSLCVGSRQYIYASSSASWLFKISYDKVNNVLVLFSKYFNYKM